MDKEILDDLRQMIREELDARDRQLEEKLAIRDRQLDEKLAIRDRQLDEKLAIRDRQLDDKLDARDQRLAAMMDEKLEPLKEDIRYTRVLVEAHDKKFQLIYEAQAETAAKFGQLDRIEKTLNDLKSEVEVIRDVVRFHSNDIETLKKAL